MFGGSFGGSGQGSSLPGASSFGGVGHGASTHEHATQGGFLKSLGGQSGNADGGERNQPPQRELMPLTLRMLIDAYDKSQTNAAQNCQDSPLSVNGRDIFMFTFVGCLDSVSLDQPYNVFVVNDWTSKILVKQYSVGLKEELKAGEYVRVHGTFRTWRGESYVFAHHVDHLDNPNELPFHFIEVAHVHLAMMGRLKSNTALAGQAGLR
mmetsp:Transcript_62141/g.98090  ORF Transcript_62141/g.98090 Transcript_62141/m.98090 type:complete len:208 (-) Transcript_62141:86-709(-)